MLKEKEQKNGRLAAFTLTELLVVLVIIGILVLIALPNLTGVVSEAHSTEAQMQLRTVHQFQKTHFLKHSKYSSSLEDINFIHEKLTTDGGNAKYRITIADAGNSSYTAQAESVVDFDQDGTFNLWEIDQNMQLKEVRKD